MSATLILLGADPGRSSSAALKAATFILREAGWRALWRSPGLAVWAHGDWDAPLAKLADGGVVVGPSFLRGPASGPPSSATIVRDRWGAYVAAWPAGDSRPPVAARDASGAREALVWRREGLWVVGERLGAPTPVALRSRVSLNGDRLARYLVDVCEIAGPLALEGVAALAPGEVRRLGEAGGGAPAVWTPAQSASRPLRGSAGEMAERLAATLRESLGAFAGLGRPLLGEISGGLDSAVMAAVLADRPQMRAWLNLHAATAEGDERVYARATAGLLGVTLTEAFRPPLGLDATIFEELAGSARPSLSAMDAGYEAVVVKLARAHGVWGVVTGQGGDTVFSGPRSAALAADAWPRPTPLSRAVRQAARLTKGSVWRISSHAFDTRRRPQAWPSWRPLLGASAQLQDLRAEGPRHPWLQDLDAAPHAKRPQIAGLAYNVLAHVDCRRSRAVQLIHGPLLQPVMELCLAIPAAMLLAGDRDRGLLRTALGDRLAPQVLTRASKGDLTAVYGRELAAALPLVREHLLDGELRRRGLLDAPRLEDRLSPDALMWSGGYGDILELLAIEVWAAGIASAQAAA